MFERTIGSEIFEDYPVGKFARKKEWWTSEKGIELMAGWRTAGYSYQDICNKIGINIKSLQKWRKECPELDRVMTEGKEVANARVENALFRRATGFYYTETVSELVEGDMRVVREFKRYCPPDTKAALSWLFNRNSANWRAVQAPLDTDAGIVANAQQMLVAIRDAAVAHAGALPSPEDTGVVLGYSKDEDAEEGQGEVKET